MRCLLKTLALLFCLTVIVVSPVRAQSGTLPDVVGIRPGLPIGDAFKLLKQHNPQGSIQYGQKQIAQLGAKPITYAFVATTTGASTDPEAIEVDLTFPPNDQTVWRMIRRLIYPPGKEPLVSAVIQSLHQKFGEELPSRNTAIHYWVFDRQGKPVHTAGGASLLDCAQSIENPNLGTTLDYFAHAPTSNLVPPSVALFPQYRTAIRDACNDFIYAIAVVQPVSGNNNLTNYISLTITDLGAGLRAGKATQAAINGANVNQQKRVLKNAQQQPTPQF